MLKLNLECELNLMNGYVNISSKPLQIPPNLSENTVVTAGHYSNFDHVIKELADEIVFNPPLNLLSPNETLPVIQYWWSKLKNGGILKLKYIDIKRLAQNIIYNEVNLQDIHNNILGANNEFRSVIDTAVFKVICHESKFKINTLAFDNIIATVNLEK